MNNYCQKEYRCGAIGLWKRCKFYQIAPYSEDCVYLQYKEFCDCKSAQEEENKQGEDDDQAAIS